MFNYTAQVTHGSPGEHQWLLLLIMHKIKHAQPYQQSCAPPPPLPPLIPPSPRLPCFMELLFVTERCDVPGLSVPDGSTRKVRTICYITKYRYKFTKKIIFSLDLILSLLTKKRSATEKVFSRKDQKKEKQHKNVMTNVHGYRSGKFHVSDHVISREITSREGPVCARWSRPYLYTHLISHHTHIRIKTSRNTLKPV